MSNITFTKAFVTGGSGFVGSHLLERLKELGIAVNALARSDSSVKKVEALGAVAIRGSIEDIEALEKGCEGCDVVFHLAAKVEIEGKMEDFKRITFDGTKNTLAAAKKQNVKTFVICSTEQVLLGGPELINIDESWPYPKEPFGPYALYKGAAERATIEANSEGFKTVSIRPRLIWGKNDTVVLPKLCEAVKTGQWKWFGGGTCLTSTSHVLNVVEGLIRGAESEKGGEIYFVTDGEHVQFKEFMGKMMKTRGVDPDACGSIPLWVGTVAGWFGIVPGPIVRLFGENCTINDSKARNLLGYKNVISIEEGLKEMEEAFAAENNKPSGQEE